MSLPSPSPESAALITGASSGIGAEIARALAARGHIAVLGARRKELLETLAAELSEAHRIRAEAISCDLADPVTRGTLPGLVKQLGLTIEVLVNNAGFATGGAFADADPDRELQQVRL